MISTPFLKEIASIILDSKTYNLPSLCMVFPNKRARLYLSKYIGEITGKPVWAPKYFTISELMEKISGYRVADRLTLLFELYNSYVKITGSTESFDSFYPYSETLLADFDEIDKYLIHANDLFQNLSDLKSLDGKFNYLSIEQLDYIRKFWSAFSTDRSQGGQELFISLWESLSGIYDYFKARLREQNLAYEGMAYRKAVEDPTGLDQVFDAGTRFLFVGFNALSTTEDNLFMQLKNSGKAEFFWDYDISYLSDVHEAGTFIRRNINRFPDGRELNHDHFSHKKNEIVFIPVYSNSGQAEILPELFDRLNLKDASAIERTALVLADENLLITALYAIPGTITDINVTMGYPLSNSAVFSLIDSLYELQRNSRKNSAGITSWYFGDIMSVMNNPLLRSRFGSKTEELRRTALDQHMVYLSISEVLPDVKDDIIFSDELQNNTIQYLLEVVTSIIRELPGGSKKASADPIQVEMLFGVYTYLVRLRDILEKHKVLPGTAVLFRLIRKMLRSMRIPFSGEPLAGLQVLGILETRTLDFDNVIVLSANEGTLPKPSEKPSFIPYNLRAGFGLPTPEHHDAIYAYYFYRLIQRARNVALVYDASSGGLQTGERSRFLHQLFYEMKPGIEELQVGSSISQIPVKSVIIHKTGEVITTLSGYLGDSGRSFSPSAINEFLNCPVKFYFHYIAGLPQPEEVAEDVDARLFGNLIHNSLRRIYEQFGKELVTGEKIRKVRNDEELIYNAIDRAFCEELFGDKDGTGNRKPAGYNLLVRQVLFTYIKQFLNTEINTAPFIVRSLEERHYVSIPVMAIGRESKVTVGGVIDRIDQKDNSLRILDYKTGGVKDRFNSVESLFSGGEKERNDAVFQVLLYSYVYDKLHPGENIVPGLFFLRQCHQDNFSASIEMGNRKKLEDYSMVGNEFEIRLKVALEELFNLEVPFVQTSNLKTCRYCPYAGICRR